MMSQYLVKLRQGMVARSAYGYVVFLGQLVLQCVVGL